MIVNCHGHYLPRAATEGLPFYSEKWSNLELQLEGMAEAGIDRQVLTYPLSDPDFRLPLPEIAQLTNDQIGAAMRQYPNKFIGTAAIVPFCGMDAVHELERAVGDLGLRGVSLATSYDGLYLDAEDLWPIYAKAQQLDVPIFVHPAVMRPLGYEKLQDYYLLHVLGYVFDTTLCIARLIYSGTLERFPGLRFVFSHLGGALPFVAARLDLAYQIFFTRDPNRKVNKVASEYFSQIYLDTTTTDPAAIRFAIEIVGADHLLLGTDYPATPAPQPFIEAVQNLALPEEDKAKVLSGNAAKLLGEE
jgi:predicted TIM-barrel fold metal-dependent hydrolase